MLFVSLWSITPNITPLYSSWCKQHSQSSPLQITPKVQSIQNTSRALASYITELPHTYPPKKKKKKAQILTRKPKPRTKAQLGRHGTEAQEINLCGISCNIICWSFRWTILERGERRVARGRGNPFHLSWRTWRGANTAQASIKQVRGKTGRKMKKLLNSKHTPDCMKRCIYQWTWNSIILNIKKWTSDSNNGYKRRQPSLVTPPIYIA